MCRRSFGLALLAIRDDEDRVRSLGIRVGWYKLGAYVLSATFTGMIGALAMYFTGLITPSSAFDRTFDISVITMTFFGGVGTVAGPVVGGLLLEPLQSYLNQQFGIAESGLNLMLFGGFLLVVILFLPQGIVPSLSQRWSIWRASRQLAPAPALAMPVQREASPAPLLLEPRSNTASLPIPHRPSQELPVVRPGTTQKVRAQRLVPISAHGSVSFSGKIPAPPVVTWRCPTCQRPFLLKGGICYCPKCGTMRPLTPPLAQ